MEVLEIKPENANILLEKFDMEVDSDSGFIVDKETREVVKCRYTNKPLNLENLGGILPGSNILIHDSDVAYAGYVMEFLAPENEKTDN